MNTKHHEHLKREAVEFHALAELGRIISSSIDPRLVFSEFAEQVRKLVDHDMIMLTHIDQKAGTGTNKYLAGDPQLWHAEGEVFPLENTFSQLVARKRRGVRITSVEAAEIQSEIASASVSLEFGLNSFICAPLISNDQVIAVLHISAFKTDAYDDHDVAIVESIAFQIAGAIANNDLYDQLEYESKEREILPEIGRKATSTSDLPDVYKEIVRSLSEVLSCDRIVISLIRSGERNFVDSFYSGITSGNVSEVIPLPFEYTLTGAVALSNSPILIQADSMGSFVKDLPGVERLREMGILSSLAVPLRFNNDVIGVLKIHSKTPSAFSQRDVYLVERIGN